MTHPIDSRDFRVPENARVDLKKWPTHVKHVYKSKKEYHEVRIHPCRCRIRSSGPK